MPNFSFAQLASIYTLSAVTDGTVMATANDASGKTGSAVITISNQSTGINEIPNSVISIYPNPTSSQLTIATLENIEFILDITAKIITIAIPTNNTIDVSNLVKGIYFLQVQTEKGLFNSTFIKE